MHNSTPCRLTLHKHEDNPRKRNHAERLVRRVNELEHQVSERAAELAKAIGDAESSAELKEAIESLSLKRPNCKPVLQRAVNASTRFENKVRMRNDGSGS